MMLVPILAGAQDWRPPAQLMRAPPPSHFADRCAERGVRSIHGHLLRWLITEALVRGRGDLVERVYSICPESTLYRIVLPEGVFYPVVRDGVPVTMFCPDQKQGLQRARRGRKRYTGKRLRRASP